MSTNEQTLAGARVVPVVVIDSVDQAVPLAECLLESGLKTIEVTLRTRAALASIRAIAANVPGIKVGAGSLRKVAQVSDIVRAGAQFAVAPGSTPSILDAAESAGLPVIPGAATATEMMQLLERGYTLQKFFPAELAGGMAFLKAVGSPLPEVRFVPTGGISAHLASEYLQLGNVAAVGGSWIAPARLLKAGDYTRIGKLAAEASQLGY